MNILAPILPLLVFGLSWRIFYQLQAEWRAAFLSAAVAWGVLLTALTEILSLFGMISFWPLLAGWGLCFLASFGAGLKIVGMSGIGFHRLRRPDLPAPFERLLLGSLAGITGLIGLIAWIAPPNTWDAMTYHMSRVEHWIQDAGLAFYPTHMISQLFLSPGAEFIFLHFQILSGGDHLANFPQWFSMIGSAIGISLIARQLGADSRGQIFSAVLAMTIPMGILQASSAHNDFVVTFWLITFVYFMLLLKSGDSPWFALGAGAGLGLAALAKATTYVLAVPFLVWIALALFKGGFARNLRLAAILSAVFLVLNMGYYVRNDQLFGSPLGTFEDVFSTGGHIQVFKYSNDLFSLPSLVSNSTRNIAINLGTPFAGVDDLTGQVVDEIHSAIGLSPNDPRTTWPGAQFEMTGISFSEDSAGNPLQVIVIAVTLLMVVGGVPRNQELVIYCLCLIGGFLLFSFYLKWQPWNSRLELPLFVLWAAVSGLKLAGVRRKWVAEGILGLLLLGALPWVFLNQARPLIGNSNIFNTSRTEQYFRNDHSLWSSYPRVAQALGDYQCRRIGLYMEGGDWEYPLWVLLHQDIGQDVRIEAVNVENVSAREYEPFPEFTPCAVLISASLPSNDFKVNGIAYSVVMTTKFMSVLMPK